MTTSKGGRKRTGYLYWTKSGWRARVTVARTVLSRWVGRLPVGRAGRRWVRLGNRPVTFSLARYM